MQHFCKLVIVACLVEYSLKSSKSRVSVAMISGCFSTFLSEAELNINIDQILHSRPIDLMEKPHSLLHSEVCLFVFDQVLRAALSLKENDLDDHLAQIIQEKRIKEQKDPT